MQRYEHGGDIYTNHGVKLDFSVNTNPLGLPLAVREALSSRIDEFTRYPDPSCCELRSAIAAHEEVPNEWILCGNGAADIIYRLCYAIKPCKALVCAPTFTEYERALEQVESQVIYHSLTPDNGFDLTDEIIGRIDPTIDMLFLCNPNNPTSRLISSELMARIMARARQTHTIVVVDECFLDFTKGESAKCFLADMPELCILKAFTKIYAMAGLRLGYLLASDKTLIEKAAGAAQCWSVSVPAQIAGVTALSCEGWQDKTLELIEEERSFLTKNLEMAGITVFPGDSNFLLLRTEYPLYEMLLEKGIMIRRCENFKGLDSSYYRISIKTRRENLCLTEAIKGCCSRLTDAAP